VGLYHRVREEVDKFVSKRGEDERKTNTEELDPGRSATFGEKSINKIDNTDEQEGESGSGSFWLRNQKGGKVDTSDIRER